MNIKHYLAGSHYSKIKNGQSGAEVYEINGDLILKQVERRKLNDSLFDTYISEALFYQAKKDDRKNICRESFNWKSQMMRSFY